MRSLHRFGLGFALASTLAAPVAALSQPMTDKAVVAEPPAAPAPLAAPAAPAAPNEPNVFIIRIYAEPKIMPVAVKIDSRKVVSLSQHTYTSLYVPAGHHEIGVQWSIFAGQISPHFDVDIEAGKTYYFSVMGTRRAAGYRTIEMKSGFSRLDPTVGAATVTECCAYTPPIK